MRSTITTTSPRRPESEIRFASMDASVFPVSPELAVERNPLNKQQGGDGPDLRVPGEDGLIGARLYCSFVNRVDRENGDGTVSRVYVPCGRWACRWCREHLVHERAALYARAFIERNERVYLSRFETREKATNAIRYATKLGHFAVVVPQRSGGAILVTTQPRKDSGRGLDPEGIEETLVCIYANIPAYLKKTGYGEKRHANVNRILREHLDRMQAETPAPQRPQRAAEGPEREARPERRVYANPRFDDLLERMDLVLERDWTKRITKYRIPDPDTERWAWLLFSHEYEALPEVGRLPRAA